jgi:uncharacterized protein (TIGR00730 family)
MSPNDKEASNSKFISLADETGVKQAVVSAVLGLWEVVNNLTRLRPSHNERYRVSIFGSARAKPGSITYEETKRAAAALAAMGCDIITGGGPGLMQAANEGAASTSKPGSSTGIRVELPFEQDVNPFVELAFEHKTFFTRLHHFVLASDAFIVAPGGIGTVLETLMVWQLLQVGHVDAKPLILVGRMWPGLLEWAKKTMLSFDPPLVNSDDLEIPRCVATADEAIALLQPHYAKWQAEDKARKK